MTTDQTRADIERYVDALDHIARVSRHARERTRRIRWIEARAMSAINGNEDWRELDLPKHAKSAAEQKEIIRRQAERIAELERLLPAVMFADAVFSSFWNEGEPGDLDGFYLQEVAEDFGLLSASVVPEDGCCESCNCIEQGAVAGDACYSPTALAIEIDRLSRAEHQTTEEKAP